MNRKKEYESPTTFVNTFWTRNRLMLGGDPNVGSTPEQLARENSWDDDSDEFDDYVGNHTLWED